MKAKQLLPVLSLLLMMGFSAADFYSSMTKADYNSEKKTLNFTTKMDTQHIAEAIKINANTAGFEAEVKKYVNSHFEVVVNGVPKPVTFTGSQVNGESVWVYFEVNEVGDISTLKIKDAILLDAYPKQVNLVNIAYKNSQKTMNFQRGKEVNEVSF